MAEAVWNGFLRLSLVSCPVRLAPATSDAHVIRLDQLNSRTGNPVTQQFVDSRTGDVVAADAVVRGYPGGSGYVTISDSEYETLSADTSNLIEVAHFSPSDQVDRARLETSYYIYPDGPLAADTLAALRLAMRCSGSDAIAYVRLGERERMVLIQLHGAGLMLSTLRPPRVLAAAEFAERADSDVPTEMVEIAESIIARRALQSDPNALHDRYESRLRLLIAEKTGGSASLPAEPAAAALARPPAVQATSAAMAMAAPPAPQPAPPAPQPAPPPPPPAPPPQPMAAAEAPAAPAAAAAAVMPRPAPEPEPEPVPALDAAPAPEREPEGAVLAGEPDLEPVAVAAPPEPAPVPEPEPEGAVLSGEPEPEPEPEPERAVAEPPPPEPPPPEPEVAAPPTAAAAAPAAAPEPQPAPAEPMPSPSDAAALERAERRLFEGDREARELGTEILLHIMGLGDRRFVEPGWAGHPGSRRQIEAMSIRPREELEASAIEFRVFAQEGRATAWVSNGNYAGTRGRQLPLTGFAVRPAPELRDRFDIVYEGCFFDGGVVGPKRNGEICTSPVTNDPLEAVRVSIVERHPGSPH